MGWQRYPADAVVVYIWLSPSTVLSADPSRRTQSLHPKGDVQASAAVVILIANQCVIYFSFDGPTTHLCDSFHGMLGSVAVSWNRPEPSLTLRRAVNGRIAWILIDSLLCSRPSD
jgi:hypothetical protein